ncbi:MAG: ankyrin repeat domain-containing protein, partial [Gemmataceae bacterium]
MNLSEAAGAGDLETIRALLDAGADIRYIRPSGYTVMIDVMYGRSILEDKQLLPIVRLLIERGADLDAVTEYGESALSVSSRIGRFDVVGLLLDAGANPAPLCWTELHRAVALGTLEDVERCLRQNADRTARDDWDRTPWLLCLQTGDRSKAELLLAAGSNRDDQGRCGTTNLMLAIKMNDLPMLQWLLGQGCAPNAQDEFGKTALIDAAERGAADCVRVLLAAGADVHLCKRMESPIRAAGSLEVTRLLIQAGADPAEMNDTAKAERTGRSITNEISCTPGEYDAARYREFGTANPEQMNRPFWLAMVRAGCAAFLARSTFDDHTAEEAVWSFDRFGKSFTELPDGRVIEIAGEHEDYYDQDFCIYNDVIVHQAGSHFDIY